MSVQCNILPVHCHYKINFKGGREGGTYEIVNKLLPSVLNGVNQIIPSLK